MVMPFGKHKGKELADVPDSYLLWVLDNCERISPYLRRAICDRLGVDDDNEPEPAGWNVPVWGQSNGRPSASGPTANELAERVRKTLRKYALTYHPDRGGSTQAMQALNGFAEELLRYLADHKVGV